MPRVFAVHVPNIREGDEVRPKLDLRQAEIFGQVITLLPGNFRPERDPDIAGSMIEKGLEDMRPDDYLLCCGSPLAIGLAVGAAFARLGRQIRTLTWSSAAQNYIATILRLRGRYPSQPNKENDR